MCKPYDISYVLENVCIFSWSITCSCLEDENLKGSSTQLNRQTHTISFPKLFDQPWSFPYSWLYLFFKFKIRFECLHLWKWSTGFCCQNSRLLAFYCLLGSKPIAETIFCPLSITTRNSTFSAKYRATPGLLWDSLFLLINLLSKVNVIKNRNKKC